MKVNIAVLPDTVVVTEVARRDGQWAAVSEPYEVPPKCRLARVPYERLRTMGDGIYDFIEDGRYEIAKRVDEIWPPAAWGFFFFAVVCFIMIFGGYWLFDNFETEGGRIRIHWAVALVYAIGGKWAVSGVMTVATVVLTYFGMRTWLMGLAAMRHKRTYLRALLQKIMHDEPCEKRILSLFNPETEKAVWLYQQDGRMTLRLPVQFLDAAEERRAARTFGPAQPDSDPEFAEAGVTPPDFFEHEFDADVDHALETALGVFQNIYRLVPHFELCLAYCDDRHEMAHVSLRQPLEHFLDDFNYEDFGDIPDDVEAVDASEAHYHEPVAANI